MKVAVFMDHNTFIRNFIRTGSFDPLMKAHDVVFGFPANMPNRVNTDFPALGPGGRVRLAREVPGFSTSRYGRNLKWSP